MIRVLFDPEIFALQNRGGIPRLFAGLYLEFKNNPKYGIQPFIPPGPWFPHQFNSMLPARQSTITRISKLLLSQLAVWIWIPKAHLIQETYYTRWRYLGKKPRIVTIHDFIPEQNNFSQSKFNRMIDKKKRIERAAARVYDSFTTQGLAEANSLPVQYSKMIYPGLDSVALPIDLPITRDTNTFLYVGTRDGHKDFRTLLRSSEILAKQGVSIQIQVVGGGPLQPHEKLTDYGVSVVQVNASDEKLQFLYSRATATIVTSTNEGFGYPLLESFARGTEVICSDIPIFRETSGGLANFFPAGDSQELSRILLEFIQGTREIQHQPGRARDLQDVAERYSWSKCANQYANLYKSLVAAT
jgi:glycosyltransferase involved in cell wall biosynthesis